MNDVEGYLIILGLYGEGGYSKWAKEDGMGRKL